MNYQLTSTNGTETNRTDQELTPKEEQQVKKLTDYAKNRIGKGIRLKEGTYNKYIKYLRTKTFDRQVLARQCQVGPTENHHIIPKHAGGSNDPSNLIVLGKTEHILAHLLLYLEKGNKNDLITYIFRRYTKNVDLTSRVKKARMIDKLLGLGFFNSEFQQIQGKKGGQKGGSANTTIQFQARRNVGLKFGRLVGMANQSSDLKERLSYYHVWQHKTLPNIKIITEPKPAALDVMRELILKCQEQNLPKEVIPNFSQAAKGGFFFSFMKGKRPSYYGWSITLIQPDAMDEIIDD